ncbi:hypothetical protein EJB05_05563, partial [Eragrostis curvula]
MCQRVMEIVRENELSNKVVVLHGRIERNGLNLVVLFFHLMHRTSDIKDIFLLHLYTAPITNYQRYHDSIYFWQDVYGIKMSSMMPLAKQCAFMEPSVETISDENVLTWPTVVAQVDCYTIQALELEIISAAFKFTSMLNGSQPEPVVQAYLHCMVSFWFDVEFNGPVRQKPKKQATQSMDGSTQNASPSSKKKKQDVSIVLSTASEDAPTHWQQTLLYLFEPIELNKDQNIEGSVTISQSQQHARFLNICLKYL